jgi:hypothetical protein
MTAGPVCIPKPADLLAKAGFLLPATNGVADKTKFKVGECF